LGLELRVKRLGSGVWTKGNSFSGVGDSFVLGVLHFGLGLKFWIFDFRVHG